MDEALDIGHALNVDLVKFSLDIKRPRQLYGSCMHPDVMRQLADKYDIFKNAIPKLEEYGLKLRLRTTLIPLQMKYYGL